MFPDLCLLYVPAAWFSGGRRSAIMNPSHMPASDTWVEGADLDPRSEEEWAALERAGLRLLEYTLERYRGVRARAAHRPVPARVRQALAERPPRKGLGIEAALG